MVKDVDYNNNHDAIPVYIKETPDKIAYKQARFFDLAKFISEQLAFKTHLDVGCGSGYFIKAMREYNKISFGTEIGYMYHQGLFPEISSFVFNIGIFELEDLEISCDIVSAMELLEHLYAENFWKNDLNKGILNLINCSKKYIFLTMPVLTPSYCPWIDWNGRDPKIWCRILTKHEVPLNEDGTPILGHVTLATEAWWRCKLESFGLFRLKDVENTINYQLASLDPGLLEWWHIFLYQK